MHVNVVDHFPVWWQTRKPFADNVLVNHFETESALLDELGVVQLVLEDGHRHDRDPVVEGLLEPKHPGVAHKGNRVGMA